MEAAEDVHDVIDTGAANPNIVKLDPRFLVVRSRDRLLGLDMRTPATLDVPLVELARHSEFFLPWAGIRRLSSRRSTLLTSRLRRKWRGYMTRSSSRATSPEGLLFTG